MADRQMEFVATVSHERDASSVICAAARTWDGVLRSRGSCATALAWTKGAARPA
jgi:hypothetical protein